jgi:outer membrane protein assembly factor BamB
MKYLIPVFLLGSLWLMFASDPGTGDWPMWGGTPDRNMVSPMKGIPLSWDIKTKKNVKWMAELGSQSYGNPVVAGGQVYAGTNNELVRNPKEPGDRGVLMCFRESDGKFLWQHANEKLAAGRALDWPFQGVCSSPLVEGERLYYVTNRCELVCLDTKGDGNGGAKIIWKFDMIDEVGSSPHNMSNSSPVSYGDLLFVSTSNGQDPEHGEGVGHLYAIDPTKRGDITQTGRIWHYDKIRRSISTGAIYNGLLFYADFSGFLHCLDLNTGKPYWTHDMLAAVWGSPMVINGKVYLGDEDGDIVVLEAAKEKKLIGEMNMGSSVYATAVPANGTLFLMNRNQLWALSEK